VTARNYLILCQITRFANQVAKWRSFTAPFDIQHYADRLSLDMGFVLN